MGFPSNGIRTLRDVHLATLAVQNYMFGPRSPDKRAEKPATFNDLAPIKHDFEALEETGRSKWTALLEVDEHVVYAENFLRQTFAFVAGLAPNVSAKDIYGALDL